MIGMIVTGHGNFATGISSSVRLIAGPQENYEAVDFLEGDSGETLMEKLRSALERLAACEEIIVFSDLAGGSPFQTAAGISVDSEKRIEVISGTNVGMLLECAMQRDRAKHAEELVQAALDTGKKQVLHFACTNLQEQEEISEGI